jgi:hypothetical protein
MSSSCECEACIIYQLETPPEGALRSNAITGAIVDNRAKLVHTTVTKRSSDDCFPDHLNNGRCNVLNSLPRGQWSYTHVFCLSLSLRTGFGLERGEED